MKTLIRTLSVAGVICAVTMPLVHAQQVPLPTTSAPAPGTAMTKPYVQMVARMAYFWGWPLVNAANRAHAFSEAPEPGLMGGVIPVAYNRLAMLTGYIAPNQHFIACPNQDVAYGAGFFDLDKEAAIIQVPDFGDRFWVFALYDGRTDEFASIGKQFGTRPGFYLMVGPNWKGEAPAGVNAVVRSSTRFAFLVPRIFMDDTPEDHTAIQPALSQINAYPLSSFDGKIKVTDWSKLPAFPGPEVRWQRRDQVGEPGHIF